MDRRSVLWNVLWIGVVELAFCSFARCANADEVTIRRFQQEYPRAHSALKAQFERVKGRGWLTESRAGKESPRKAVEFANDGGFRKAHVHPPPSPKGDQSGREIIYCIGPDAGFILGRTEPSAPFVVEDLGGKPVEPIGITMYQAAFGRFLEAPYSVLGRDLAEILAGPATRVVDAREERGPNTTFVHLELEVGKESPPSKCSIVLEPGRGWAIVSAELVAGPANSIRTRQALEYRPDSHSALDLAEASIEMMGVLRMGCRFESIDASPTDGREFTTAFYGLGDLENVDSRPADRRPWVLGASVLAILLSLGSFGLWRAAQRRREI